MCSAPRPRVAKFIPRREHSQRQSDASRLPFLPTRPPRIHQPCLSIVLIMEKSLPRLMIYENIALVALSLSSSCSFLLLASMCLSISHTPVSPPNRSRTSYLSRYLIRTFPRLSTASVRLEVGSVKGIMFNDSRLVSCIYSVTYCLT